MLKQRGRTEQQKMFNEKRYSHWVRITNAIISGGRIVYDANKNLKEHRLRFKPPATIVHSTILWIMRATILQ